MNKVLSNIRQVDYFSKTPERRQKTLKPKDNLSVTEGICLENSKTNKVEGARTLKNKPRDTLINTFFTEDVILETDLENEKNQKVS